LSGRFDLAMLNIGLSFQFHQFLNRFQRLATMWARPRVG